MEGILKIRQFFSIIVEKVMMTIVKDKAIRFDATMTHRLNNISTYHMEHVFWFKHHIIKKKR